MNTRRSVPFLLAIVVGFTGALSATPSIAQRPTVIAHRGASGYLPEHTLAAAAMAHQMGVHYIEQDVVLTKDDVPIVLHDIHLDTVSDVDTKFPNRARADGRFYTVDFSIDEIKSLRLGERRDAKTKKPVFPKRFPADAFLFTIPTLAEEITLIQGLNHSTGRNIGIYVEIKEPAFHRNEGRDISAITLKVLQKFGYARKSDNALVQCFDATETARMRNELGTQLRLVQLLSAKDWNKPDDSKPRKLERIAKYADAVGPSISIVLGNSSGNLEPTDFAANAHAAGLLVHAFTARTDQLPNGASDYSQLISVLFNDAKIDGVFTDQPDATLSAID